MKKSKAKRNSSRASGKPHLITLSYWFHKTIAMRNK